MPFSVAEALRAGIPYSRLRRADLTGTFHGVRSTGTPSGQVARALAYAPRLRPGQCFSHGTAASLWGMWIPDRLMVDARVTVLAVHPADRPRSRGVRAHRTRVAALGFARGLPVTSPADTWVRLGGLLSRRELVAAGDSIVRRQDPLGTLEDLAGALDTLSDIPGVAAARVAIGDVRPGADSAQETSVRLLLARARLPEPEVNGLIVTRGGVETHGDLVLREWKVLVEYDGRQHRASAQQFERDILRLEELAADGWTVIRIVSTHLRDPAAVVGRIARTLRSRGWRGTPSVGQVLRDPWTLS